MKCRLTLKFILIFFTISISIAQNETTKEELSLNSGTIDNQFEYVIRKSGKYQEYKVVKRTWLYTLKAHTLDSLKAVRQVLNDTKAIVNTQAKEINDLKSSLSNTKTELNNTVDEKDSMSLFGLAMSKAVYNTLMWFIIAVLFTMLLFFVYKFKNSNTLTKQAKVKLRELETEYEDHRRVALEREQKVRRQLQDEINKNKKSQ